MTDPVFMRIRLNIVGQQCNVMRALVLATVLSLVTSGVAATHTPYVEALTVAQAFLNARAHRDADAGLQLMSPDLRRPSRGQSAKDQESWLRLYIQGLSNPHHMTFEIGRGTEAQNRVTFPVTLYEFAEGEGSALSYSSSIEVSLEGQSWRVTKLPKSSDNEG